LLMNGGDELNEETIVIKPQPGPQEAFLSTTADICIYGGAAGAGKTYAILLDPLRHIANKKFGCVIFRKNSNQIFSEGGLWDTAMTLYPPCGGRPVKTPSPTFKFKSGMKVTFAHMELEKDVLKWQGSQIALICFDELTHFKKSQFFYMLSRNRSSSKVPGYLRATCNPDADSWVAEFIAWWINQDTGYPIPERSGVIRWMVNLNDTLYWADTKDEVIAMTGCDPDDPKSVTFIMSTVEDNQIMLKDNPGYISSLKALGTVERERLHKGNWKIKPAAGLYFKRARVTMVEEIPKDVYAWVRAWDMAATEDKKDQRPEDGAAYTAGVLMGRRRNGRFIIVDVINKRLNAADVRATIKTTAIIDKAKYKNVTVKLNQDPGQAGKDQAEQYLKFLQGFAVTIERESGSKETRADPLSAQWMGVQGSEYGNVDVLIAPWNEEYFGQLEGFPQIKFKDMVDASGSAFNELMKKGTSSPPPDVAGNEGKSQWVR